MITIIADKYHAAQVLLVESIMIPFEHPLCAVYTFMQVFCDADDGGSLQVYFNTLYFTFVRYATKMHGMGGLVRLGRLDGRVSASRIDCAVCFACSALAKLCEKKPNG